jgi:hypothetical protein
MITPRSAFWATSRGKGSISCIRSQSFFPGILFDAEIGHIWNDIAKFCIGVISELPLPADWSLLLTSKRPFKVNLQHFHLYGYLVSWKEWCPEV